MYDHVYYSKQTTNKPREHVDGQFGARENSNNALTGTRHFIGTKLIVKPNDTDFKKMPWKFNLI